MTVDPDELLTKTLELYESCSSYSDVGEASCDMGKLQFKTYFCRPSQFRFEWSNMYSEGTNVIFSDSDSKVTYFDGESDENTGSLALAVAGATGVSLGVAPLVAHLLMPTLFESGQFQSFVSLRPYSFVEEDDSYVKIRANWRSNCWTTLLVDKVRLALRAVEEGFTATVEEKQRGIEAMQTMEASELEEVRALLLIEEKPQVTMVSYSDVKFDMPISPDLFRKL
ncbi:MAG TPA: hypothetical protein V6C97_24185 [Oculatellaceae cyanobacterium]